MALRISWDPDADGEFEQMDWSQGALPQRVAKQLGRRLQYLDEGLRDETSTTIDVRRQFDRWPRASGAVVPVYKDDSHGMLLAFAVDWVLGEVRVLALAQSNTVTPSVLKARAAAW